MKEKSDWLGIFGSSLCLIHCLLTPLVFGVWMLAGAEMEWIEQIELIFIAISFFAIWFSTKRTPSVWLKIVLWVFFALLVIGSLGEAYFEPVAYLIYFASIGLIITHIYNIRLCRQCAIPHKTQASAQDV